VTLFSLIPESFAPIKFQADCISRSNGALNKREEDEELSSDIKRLLNMILDRLPPLIR
jgi:hypothetical protein